MKKCVISLLCIVLCLALVGCKSSQPEVTEPLATTAPVETTEETVAPVFLAFEDIRWTRESENCIETICFLGNGGFRYSCACGDPVNDADLCEGYRYEEERKTIYLDFEETTEQTVTQITVKSCDGKTLVLDFNGELRTFQLAEDVAA